MMTMNPETLYLQLRRLVATMPQLDSGVARTPETLQWLGRAAALVEASGDVVDFVQFKSSADSMDFLLVGVNARKIESIVHRALARAELRAPVSAQGAFIAAGDTLNAFAAVAKVLGRAMGDILMVDA